MVLAAFAMLSRADRESHWQEHHLNFLEKPHIYLWKGKPVRTSATGLNKKYFTGFDARAVVEQYWPQWKASKSNKYGPLVRYLTLIEGKDEEFAKTAIMALWDYDRNLAAAYGTAMHLQFEKICLGQAIPAGEAMDELPMFTKWITRFCEQGGWQIWACEYVIVKLAEGNPDVAVWCGSVDLILKHVKTPDTYCAIDYKSTDPKDGLNLLDTTPVVSARATARDRFQTFRIRTPASTPFSSMYTPTRSLPTTAWKHATTCTSCSATRHSNNPTSTRSRAWMLKCSALSRSRPPRRSRKPKSMVTVPMDTVSRVNSH